MAHSLLLSLQVATAATLLAVVGGTALGYVLAKARTTWLVALEILLSLPMGFDADGMPLGLQLMAAPFRDPLVLRVGKAYERATDWHERRPAPAAPA